MKHLALSLLALASTLTAQQWPFNIEPFTGNGAVHDVVPDPVTGKPLLVAGVLTPSGCADYGGGLLRIYSDAGYAPGTRIRLRLRHLAWQDDRTCMGEAKRVLSVGPGPHYSPAHVVLPPITEPFEIESWYGACPSISGMFPSGLAGVWGVSYSYDPWIWPSPCCPQGFTIPKGVVVAFQVDLY